MDKYKLKIIPNISSFRWKWNFFRISLCYDQGWRWCFGGTLNFFVRVKKEDSRWMNFLGQSINEKIYLQTATPSPASTLSAQPINVLAMPTSAWKTLSKIPFIPPTSFIFSASSFPPDSSSDVCVLVAPQRFHLRMWMNFQHVFGVASISSIPKIAHFLKCIYKPKSFRLVLECINKNSPFIEFLRRDCIAKSIGRSRAGDGSDNIWRWRMKMREKSGSCY